MNQGRQNRFLTVLPFVADPASVSTVPDTERPRPASPRRGTRSFRRLTIPLPDRVVTSSPRMRWTRPRRPLSSRARELAPLRQGFATPRLPSGIPEEDSTSLQTLAVVLNAYHRTLPTALRDEYVRQLMKFAGEKAGQLIRASWERR